MRLLHTCAFTLILAALLLVTANTTVAWSQDNSAIIAAQVHKLRGETLQEIGIELDKLKDAGYNAVILRVFQNRGDRFHTISGRVDKESTDCGIYFRSSRAVLLTDLVTPVSVMCHERGLLLFAWMTTRRMDWLDRSEWSDMRYYPGEKEIRRSDHYDLFNPEYQEYLLGLLTDLAAQPIDGIILQDDFTIKTWEGITPEALLEFRRRENIVDSADKVFRDIFIAENGNHYPSGRGPLWEKWIQLKADVVHELGERFILQCRTINPVLMIGANLYYDTALEKQNGREWLSQSVEGLAGSSFDLVLHMSYHRQMARETGISVIEAIAALSEKNVELQKIFGSRLMLKFQTINWETGEQIPENELFELAKAFYESDVNLAFAPIEIENSVNFRPGRTVK